MQEEHLTLEQAVEQAKNEPSPSKPGITSYAQNFEDVMLWRALGHIENGFYIDIGAHHHSKDSVSKAFYDRGWSGINVEPLDYHYKNLLVHRPNDINLKAVVGRTTGQISFFQLDGLSTAVKSIADNHHNLYSKGEWTTSQQITLFDILEYSRNREVHWLKIDAEGNEPDIIDGWGASARRPWVIVVESTIPNSRISIHHRFEEAILSRDYAFVYSDSLNRFYLSNAHRELTKYFQDPPNVFDNFKLKLE